MYVNREKCGILLTFQYIIALFAVEVNTLFWKNVILHTRKQSKKQTLARSAYGTEISPALQASHGEEAWL